MHTINKHRIRQRIAHVYDVAHGAQSTAKGIKEYVGNLEKAGGLRKEGAGNAAEFLREVGGGI